MYTTNNHSFFKLEYHLVLVTKNRIPLIDDQVSALIKDMFVRIGSNHNITMTSWQANQDYVYVRLAAHPKTSLTNFITAYKAASSRTVKRDFPELIEKMHKGAMWSNSFCLVTSGEFDEHMLHAFIDNKIAQK